MPYVPGTSGISDVYYSNNVFANSVKIALWQNAGVSAIFKFSAPEDPPTTIESTQQAQIDALVDARKARGPDPDIVISDGMNGAGTNVNVAAGGSGPSGGFEPSPIEGGAPVPVEPAKSSLSSPPAGGTGYGNYVIFLIIFYPNQETGLGKKKVKVFPVILTSYNVIRIVDLITQMIILRGVQDLLVQFYFVLDCQKLVALCGPMIMQKVELLRQVDRNSLRENGQLLTLTQKTQLPGDLMML